MATTVHPFTVAEGQKLSDLLRAKLFANGAALANELLDSLIMRARNGSHKATALILERVDGRFDLRPQGNGNITLMFISGPRGDQVPQGAPTRACSLDTGYEVRVLPSQSQAQSQAPADVCEPVQADDSEQAPLDTDDRTPTQ